MRHEESYGLYSQLTSQFLAVGRKLEICFSSRPCNMTLIKNWQEMSFILLYDHKIFWISSTGVTIWKKIKTNFFSEILCLLFTNWSWVIIWKVTKYPHKKRSIHCKKNEHQHHEPLWNMSITKNCQKMSFIPRVLH